jgi:hypothetical protein
MNLFAAVQFGHALRSNPKRQVSNPKGIPRLDILIFRHFLAFGALVFGIYFF